VALIRAQDGPTVLVDPTADRNAIIQAMQASAVQHGCHFHRAFAAKDGTAFYALACWETRDGAHDFFEEWDIDDEPGEVATRLIGHVGLVPLPAGPDE